MVHPDSLFGRLGNRLFQMAYIYAQMRKGHISDIYVQDYNQFKDYEEDIKQWFGKDMGFVSQVSIHVRRGDYVDNPFHVDLNTTDYYEKAIALFPEDNFLVFSDDPEWCKTRFIGERFQIMDRTDDIEDFNLAASCKSHIIANSSYSWWYAFLSPNLSKTVVAPKQWFKDGINRVTLPDTWITL